VGIGLDSTCGIPWHAAVAGKKLGAPRAHRSFRAPLAPMPSRFNPTVGVVIGSSFMQMQLGSACLYRQLLAHLRALMSTHLPPTIRYRLQTTARRLAARHHRLPGAAAATGSQTP